MTARQMMLKKIKYLMGIVSEEYSFDPNDINCVAYDVVDGRISTEDYFYMATLYKRLTALDRSIPMDTFYSIDLEFQCPYVLDNLSSVEYEEYLDNYNMFLFEWEVYVPNIYIKGKRFSDEW